jgi:hypothetical protein
MHSRKRHIGQVKGDHYQHLKPPMSNWLIISGEVILFSIVLVVIWLDEFIDLPYLFLGAPPTPYRVQEYLLETSLILVIAIFVITTTMIILRRLERLEHFMKVCAWCKKIWVDDKWVDFEDYALSRHSLKASHGICDECKAGLKMIRKENNDDKPPHFKTHPAGDKGKYKPIH